MIKRLNKDIIVSLLLFMLISIITINSSMIYLSSSLGNLALKQGIWYMIGIGLIIIIANSNNKNLIIPFYIINIFLLFILLILGNPINGSKCWLIIPKIGSFQPSEFMKISIILILSKYISKWEDNINKLTIYNELKLLLIVFILLLIPTVLTFLEPDTGAIIIYLVITITILWTSKLRKRWFIILGTIAITSLSLFLYIYFFKQEVFVGIFGTDLFYRIDRLLDWKNGTGMQLENALTSISSAGLLGHGYLKTPIYFPESGTDFIFAVYASNFGLIGSIFLLVILLYFDLSLIKIAKRCKNNYNKYIITGTIGMLLYQQIQNIGMTIGILPITGITLPFISYGGSSLLSYLLIIGIILKIDKKKYIN